MNLITTEIINTAIEQRRYLNSEELKSLNIWLKERQNEVEIAKTVSDLKEELLKTIKIQLSSKVDAIVNSFNLKDNSLKQQLSVSLSKYIIIFVDFVDTCLRLTCYDLISGEIGRLLEAINPKDMPHFLETTGISLKIIFDDFNETKELVTSQIPTEFQDKFIKYFQPITEVIRPLAKVANDRHNLAQIARNCRYQQLN
jgi:hypothetical protein